MIISDELLIKKVGEVVVNPLLFLATGNLLVLNESVELFTQYLLICIHSVEVCIHDLMRFLYMIS
jgi:hypothetical protein